MYLCFSFNHFGVQIWINFGGIESDESMEAYNKSYFKKVEKVKEISGLLPIMTMQKWVMNKMGPSACTELRKHKGNWVIYKQEHHSWQAYLLILQHLGVILNVELRYI